MRIDTATMDPLNNCQSSSSLNDDSMQEPTLPLLLVHHSNNESSIAIPMHPQRLESQSPPQQPPATKRRTTAHTAVVSFNDHIEIQHYNPLPEYSDDDSDDYYFYNASDTGTMMLNDDSEADENDDDAENHNDEYMLHRITDGNNHNYNNRTDSTDLFGLLPTMVVDDTSQLPPSSFFRLDGGDDDIPLGEQQEHLQGMSRSRSSISIGRPFPRYHLMNENLQGYTDLTDFATLTDSSNSDTDSSSDYHDSLSHVPPASQTHLPLQRHSNLAEQILLSSSSIPPLERINIVVDEYDMSSSSGSDVSDLHSHHHFVDPNLYPLQQQYRVGDDDDQEYYFEVQSLDSCFVQGIHPPQPLYDDENNNQSVRLNRHPHYRLSILKQRLWESKMGSLTGFRRHSKSSSQEETEVSYSNNNDIIVQAEPILLP